MMNNYNSFYKDSVEYYESEEKFNRNNVVIAGGNIVELKTSVIVVTPKKEPVTRDSMIEDLLGDAGVKRTRMRNSGNEFVKYTKLPNDDDIDDDLTEEDYINEYDIETVAYDNKQRISGVDEGLLYGGSTAKLNNELAKSIVDDMDDTGNTTDKLDEVLDRIGKRVETPTEINKMIDPIVEIAEDTINKVTDAAREGIVSALDRISSPDYPDFINEIVNKNIDLEIENDDTSLGSMPRASDPKPQVDKLGEIDDTEYFNSDIIRGGVPQKNDTQESDAPTPEAERFHEMLRKRDFGMGGGGSAG